MLSANFGVCRVYIFHTTKHEASFALLDFCLNIPAMDSTACISPSQPRRCAAILPSPSVPPKMCWNLNHDISECDFT